MKLERGEEVSKVAGIRIMNEREVQRLREKHLLDALTEFAHSVEASHIDFNWVFPRFSEQVEAWEKLKTEVNAERTKVAENRRAAEIYAEIEALMAKLEK